MTLTIKSAKSAALKTLGTQLEKTGFHVDFDSATQISVVNIGRKSQNYIKKLRIKLKI